jgi:DNA-binding cell septation regulator SpoVG
MRAPKIAGEHKVRPYRLMSFDHELVLFHIRLVNSLAEAIQGVIPFENIP